MKLFNSDGNFIHYFILEQYENKWKYYDNSNIKAIFKIIKPSEILTENNVRIMLNINKNLLDLRNYDSIL